MTRPPPSDVRILVWMCVLIGINQLGFGSVVPVLPLYARSFGVSQTAIGLSIAVYGLARFLVAMPVGQLSDRLGRRPALALGGLVTAAGNLLCAFAPNYPTFVGARFVAGVGAAFVLTAGQIVLADITTPAVRGRAMAIYQGSFLFAVGLGPFPGGVLAERFGLSAPFVAYAIPGFSRGWSPGCRSPKRWCSELRAPRNRSRRPRRSRRSCGSSPAGSGSSWSAW